MKKCCKEILKKYKERLQDVPFPGEEKGDTPIDDDDLKFNKREWSKIKNRDTVLEIKNYYVDQLKKDLDAPDVIVTHGNLMRLDKVVGYKDNAGQPLYSTEEIKTIIGQQIKKGISHLYFIEEELKNMRLRKRSSRNKVYSTDKNKEVEVYNDVGEAMESEYEKFEKTGEIDVGNPALLSALGGEDKMSHIFVEIAAANGNWESVLDKYGIVYMETVDARS